MKNITLKLAVIVVCLIAALTIASFAYSDASTTAIFGTPRVDGIIDKIWENAHKEEVALFDTESVIDDSIYDSGEVGVKTDATASFRTMWDEDYFYVLIEVEKNAPLSLNYGGGKHTDDCAQICIGLDGFFGANVWNAGFPNSGIFGVTLNGDKIGHGAGYDRYQYEYRGKMKKTSETAYVVEYAIPWPTREFTLCSDSVVALDIIVNIADGGHRIGILNWSNTPCLTKKGTHDWTTECGTVYLEGIENMGYPTRAETLPEPQDNLIELFGTIGYLGIDLSDGTEIASRFVVQSGIIKDITVECPSWMDSYGSLTFRLYEWAGDYETTVAADPLFEVEHIDFPDNALLHFTEEADPETGKKIPLGFGAGEYLLWVGNGSDEFGQGVGVYSKDSNQNDPRVIGTYIDGEFTDKTSMIARVYLEGAEAVVFPDAPTEDTTAEESTEEITTEEETTEEVTTEEETTEEVTTEEETTEDVTTEEETTAVESEEETTVADSEEETTVEDETTAEEGGEVAPPTADYMAIAALAAIACGVVLIFGKNR